MTDPIHRLEMELAELRDRSRSLAEQLYRADLTYLRALGVAARQQLILASYRICTHKYPEGFLALSLAQRQTLQQSLRQAAKDLADRLVHNLVLPIPRNQRKTRIVKVAAERFKGEGRSEFDSNDDDGDNSPSTAEVAAALAAAFNSLVQIESIDLEDSDTLTDDLSRDRLAEDSSELDDSDDDDADDGDDSDDADVDADADDVGDADASHSEGVGIADPSAETVSQEIAAIDDRLPSVLAALAENPRNVLQWQRSREKLTSSTLRAQSHKANELLRAAEILPRKLPSAVLDIAAKGDLDEVAGSSPNLIDLIMQNDEDNDERRMSSTRLVAVHLRLSEIHFSDPTLKQHRAAVQQVLEKLALLRARYDKLRHQQAIAAAESAWRSAWFED